MQIGKHRDCWCISKEWNLSTVQLCKGLGDLLSILMRGISKLCNTAYCCEEGLFSGINLAYNRDVCSKGSKQAVSVLF